MQDKQQLKLNHQSRNLSKKTSLPLPQIPDKIYFTIGEVSKLCLLEPYVLRYWEQEFPQLNPTKRCGNRRYYKREEIILIRHIKNLLYVQGLTIDGARLKLQHDKNISNVPNDQSIESIRNIVDQLKDVLAKSKGSSNPHSVVKATINALIKLRDPYTIAQLRGIELNQVFNG